MIPFVLIISMSAVAATFAVQSMTADMSQSTVQQEVQDTSTVVRQALPQFQSSYQALVERNGGFAPNVLNRPDGGFRQHFGSFLRLLPATPKEMGWRYGLHPEDGSAWASMNYVCLQGPSVTSGNTLLGLRDALNVAHPGRTFLSDGCAMPGPAANPEQPTALTLYLVYIPPEEPDTQAPPDEGSFEPGQSADSTSPAAGAEPTAPAAGTGEESNGRGPDGNGPPGKDKPEKSKDEDKDKGKDRDKGKDDDKGKGDDKHKGGKGPDGNGPPGQNPWDDSGCKGKSPRCR